MSHVKEQHERIADIQVAHYIMGAMRDISAIELKQVRERYDKNTGFSNELRALYQLMWRIAEQAGNTEAFAPSASTSGTLYVAYTTNRHFYGQLNDTVIRALVDRTGTDDQCLVIGDTGKQLWMSRGKKRKDIKFISFADDHPTQREIVDFLSLARDHSRVFVLYPSFVTVFQQGVSMVDITFREIDHDKASDQNADSSIDFQGFLLEPDLLEMVAFFNTQVRYALFERVLLETQLSRVAARLVKMDTADQNASVLETKEQRELRRMEATLSSRRMLETLAGFIQWQTRKTIHIAQ